VLWLAQPTLYWDEWDLADWWLRTRHAGLDFHALWQPHNEHRIVLHKLLFFVTAEWGLGPIPLMFLSFLLLGATFRLLVPLVLGACAGLPRGPRMLFLLACSAFFFSWVQWQNLLMGIQVAWTSALFGLVMAVRGMVDPPSLSSSWQIAGGLILAYLSSAAWLVLIPLLLGYQAQRWWRRRTASGRRLDLLRLAGAGTVLAAMLGLYLWGLERPPHHPSPLYALSHPVEALGFLQLFWGNPFAANPAPWLPRVMGTVFGLSTFLLLELARKRRIWRTAPPLAALALASIALAHGGTLLIAIGRVGLGPDAAVASRYSTFMLVGWLALLCTGLRFFLESPGTEERPSERRRTIALAGLVILVPLGLGLLVSAGKLYRVATWQMPKRAAARVCLDDVLADSSLLPSRRTCLQALYPDPERLVHIARRLP
jgi:hypothetical protein